MIKFRKDYFEPSNFEFTNCGTRFEEVIELSDPNGSEFDIKTSVKKFDIQEYIDSFEPSVNINNIVERFTKGDFTAIPVPSFRSGLVDTTNFPETIHELNDKVNEIHALYNNLSSEQKKKLGSFDSFISAYDAGTLFEVLKDETKVVENSQVSE